tara:strand:+ start:35 stop:247 length:213 start_codon:yes stop_codon:yes gene_type:complete
VAPVRTYTRSEKNKQYAIDAVSLLRENPGLVSNLAELWERVPKDDPNKKHNQQMDVVAALWRNSSLNDAE